MSTKDSLASQFSDAQQHGWHLLDERCVHARCVGLLSVPMYKARKQDNLWEDI